MSLCLFTEEDLAAGVVTDEIPLDPLSNKTGDIWHVALPDLVPTLLYGARRPERSLPACHGSGPHARTCSRGLSDGRETRCFAGAAAAGLANRCVPPSLCTGYRVFGPQQGKQAGAEGQAHDPVRAGGGGGGGGFGGSSPALGRGARRLARCRATAAPVHCH